MQEETGFRAWLAHWWREFRQRQWAGTLRSSLFLASFSAILSAFGHLDWVDVLALKLLPENAFEQRAKRDGASFPTLVLTLTPEFFETEFGGHTPINRDRFQDLIRDALRAYPNARVLAVDYDFSPGGGVACEPGGDRSVCAIARIEAEQQARFERFLSAELKQELGARRVSVVLITPLPAPEESAPAKEGWVRRMSDAGVRFGDHALLYHNWLATVVKHRKVAAARDPCISAQDLGRPFAAVANAAHDCAAGKRARALPAAAHPANAVELINFGEARNAVFLCPLWDWGDVTENCRRRLKAAASDPEHIERIFIGSSYGQEDRFRTPLGDQYGVEIHALSAYSLNDPVRELIPFSFVFDIVLGIVSAMVFQILWGGAARYRDQSGARFVCILAVFAVLIALALFAVWLTPWMLNRGAWLNPLLILVGFFIDSYQGAVERVGAADQQAASAPATSGYLLREFTGAQKDGRMLVNANGLARAQPEVWFQFGKKILFYWGVVLWGLYYVLGS